MKDSPVGRAPASKGAARRGEARAGGGDGQRRRLPDPGNGAMPAKASCADPEAAAWSPARVTPCHPTKWWRYHMAQDFDVRSAGLMRNDLAKVSILGAPRWPEAAAGDAAAAVGIAFTYARGDHARLRDLAMTALALAALGGSAGACLVMSRLRRALPGAGAADVRIADSWMAYASAHGPADAPLFSR